MERYERDTWEDHPKNQKFQQKLMSTKLTFLMKRKLPMNSVTSLQTFELIWQMKS